MKKIDRKMFFRGRFRAKNSLRDDSSPTRKTAQWNIHRVNTIDGECLRAATSFNFSEKVDHTFLIVNGKSEWIEKYDHIPKDIENAFSRKGLTLGKCRWMTYDHRGQGESTAAPGHATSFKRQAHDLKRILSFFSVPESELIIFAHSMGGMITLYACLLGLIKPKAIVLSSPFFRLPPLKYPLFLAEIFANLASALGLFRAHTGAAHFERAPFEENVLTHDIHFYQALKKSRFRSRSPTFGWVRAAFRAHRDIFSEKKLRNLDVPVLLFSATQDKVIDPRAHAEWIVFASRFAHSQVSFREIEGAYHELFAESDNYRLPVFDEIAKWLSDREYVTLI